MAGSKKKFVLSPITIIIVTILILSIIEPWKLLKWIPLKDIKYFNTKFEDSGLWDPKQAAAQRYFYANYSISGELQGHIAKMRDFIKSNQGDSQHHFAFAMMTTDGEEMIRHLHQAEKLNKETPLYPYYLGLAYSNQLYRSEIHAGIPVPEIESNKDSALTALNRASELWKENAVIDLAKAALFIEEQDDSHASSYIQRRDSAGPGSYIEHRRLKPEAREALREAMYKSEFNMWTDLPVTMQLQLLEDAGIDNFFARTYFMGTFLEPKKNWGMRHFINDIGPFETLEEIEAVADTIMRLAHLNLMMMQNACTINEYSVGSIKLWSILDILGDLYLVNDMPHSERMVGLNRVVEEVWSRLWNRSKPFAEGPAFWGFKIGIYIFLKLSYLMMGMLFFLFLVALAGILGTVFTPDPEEKFGLVWARITVVCMFLFGFIFTVMIGLFTQPDFNGIGIIIAAGFFVYAILVYIALRIIKKTRVHPALIWPLWLGLISLLGFLSAFVFFTGSIRFGSLILALLIIPIILASVGVTLYTKSGWSSFWRSLSRLSAEVFAVLSIILLVQLSFVFWYLGSFMRMDEFTMMTQVKGPYSSKLTHYPRYGAHYIANDGSAMEAREYRLKSLEMLFGKRLESGIERLYYNPIDIYDEEWEKPDKTLRKESEGK